MDLNRACASCHVVDRLLECSGANTSAPRHFGSAIVVYFLYQMRFAFDAATSGANTAKHGIDFMEAQALWLDPDRIEFPARPTEEPRFLLIGQITQTLWAATVTYRHEETIRLISVRRARDSEKAQYLDAQAQRH
jgi:uncharacterized DUF497 family protein